MWINQDQYKVIDPEYYFSNALYEMFSYNPHGKKVENINGRKYVTWNIWGIEALFV